MSVIAILPYTIDALIKNRSKPNIDNFLKLFRESIDIAGLAGSGIVSSSAQKVADTYRYATQPTETEVKSCPLSGELKFRHIFPSGKTPITNVKFEAKKTGITNSFSKSVPGTTDQEGYGILKGCEAGAEYKITFYPDYTGTSKEAIDKAFQSIISEMEGILRKQWDSKLSNDWDKFFEVYKSQTEIDKIFTTMRTYNNAFKKALVSMWDGLVDLVKLIVNNWDSITETTLSALFPASRFAFQAIRKVTNTENTINKFILESIKKLKELDKVQLEKIFFLLVDKAFMYTLFATCITWVMLLPPDLLSEFIARGFAEVIINIIIGVLLGPEVVANIGRTVVQQVQTIALRTAELFKGVNAAERIGLYMSEIAEFMLKAVYSITHYKPKYAVIHNSSLADEAEAIAIIANKVDDAASVGANANKGANVGSNAGEAANGERTITEIKSSNTQIEYLDEAPSTPPGQATSTETPTNGAGKKVDSDANTIKNGEPISMVTGEELLTLTDGELKGLLDFTWKRLYRTSAAETDSGLGYGWSHSLSHQLVIQGNHVHWINDENKTTVLPLPTEELPFGFNKPSKASIYFGKDPSEYILAQPEGQGFYHFKKTKSGLQLEAITDRYNNRISITRNITGRIHRIHNGAGRALCIRYHNSHIQAVDYQQQLAGDNEEQSWKTLQTLITYEYNAQNQLIKATNALNQTEHYHYDELNVIQSRQMAGGAIFYWQWQGEGKFVRCIKHWSNIEQLQTTYDWDDNGTVTVTRQDGSQLVYTHQDAKLVKQINPDGGELQNTYDDDGHLIASRTPLGAETLYQYTGDQLSAIFPPEGAATHYLYQNGHVHKVVQGEATWRYQHNEQGHITQQIDPQGATTRYSYTPTGKISTIHYPDGSVHQLQWNRLGQLIEETLPQGGIRRYRYDSLGHQITRQNERGQITQFEYDALGRVTRIIQADGSQSSYQYNAYHKITQVTDEQGRVTRYQYADHLHLISQKINPDGSTVHYQYNNPDLNLTDITNEQGEHYHLDYYSNGLISQEIGFDGRKTSYQYDVGGNLVAKTDYDDQGNTYTTTYLRSPTGKLLQKTLPDGKKINYAYNEQGLLQSVDDGHWPLNYEYDITGKLAAEHQGWATLRYQYSPLGILSQCKLPDGNVIDYKYQKGGQLAQINLNDQKLTEHFYSLGKEVERQQGSLTSQYDYDEQGRLKTHFINNSQKNLYQRKYQYNANGNLAAIEDSCKGIRQYHYDPLDRLVQVRGDISEDLIHDPAGNLLAQDHKTQQANVKGNRLLMQGDKHFTYDSFGNLIQEACGQGQKLVTQYQYDSQQQLIKATMPDGTSASYQYDAFGRRISKTVTNKTGQKTKTEFIWLGEKLLAESSKGHYQSYLYELGTFKPLALLKGKGKKAEIYYYQLDHLGTPQELTAANGAIAWSAKYKAYGNLALQEQIEGMEQPLRFQGQYHDLETGLYYNRNRYYSPDTGRYITLDPIKLAGGLNSYQYCNNPINWIDPLGLNDECSILNKDKSTTPEEKAKVDEGTPPIPTYTIEEVDPRILISRQDKTEMESSKIKRLKKKMKDEGFVHNPDEPVSVVNADGKLIIIDGHHRVQAAKSSKLQKITILLRKASSREESDRLIREAAEAAARDY